jgi:hypothetical protein
MDLVILLLTVTLCVASWGLLELCDRLGRARIDPTWRSSTSGWTPAPTIS